MALTADQRRSQAQALRSGPETRYLTGDLETRSAGGQLHFRGYASVFDSKYSMGWYDEQVAKRAFQRTLSEHPDVMLLANHEGLPLARTTNGSLRLNEDDIGLRFEAIADPDDPDAVRVHRRVKSGLMDQASFSFKCVRDSWNAGCTERSLHEVSLHRGDISVVNMGANPATSVNVRSLLAARGMRPRGTGGLELDRSTYQIRYRSLVLTGYADELQPKPEPTWDNTVGRHRG